MLLQFNFKNFKSFRDDTTLDLTATKISEYNNHVVSIANERVLPVAAIFGANASGKSNVQEAFRYMAMYVINSLDYGDESDQKKKKSKFFKPTPFLFDSKSKTEESSFEVYFIDSEEAGAKTYNYGFTVDSTGVCEEWLNYKSKSSRGDYKRIFYRCGNECDLSGIPAKSQENLKIALEKELQNLVYGSVEVREKESKKYIYVHYREDGISLTKYAGEYSNQLYNLI